MHCYPFPPTHANSTHNEGVAGASCIGRSAVSLPAEAQSNLSDVACAHYLAGFVAGPIQRVQLGLAGQVMNDASVVFATGFHAAGELTGHAFARYYGGAAGVMGLGMIEGLWDMAPDGRTLGSEAGEVVSGSLRALWLQQQEDMARVWSLALPREEGEDGKGRFVVGGLVAGGKQGVQTVDDGIAVSMSTGEGRDSAALMGTARYNLPGVRFGIAGGTQQDESGEMYFVDSALPVIYTSAALAKDVSALFSPPGVYDADAGVYVVDCNAPGPNGVSIIIEDGSGRSLSVRLFPKNLIVRMPLDNRAGGACMSGFQSSVEQPEWRRLGWPFFRNAVVTVDVAQWVVNVTAKAWPEGALMPASPPSLTSQLTTTKVETPPSSTTAPIPSSSSDSLGIAFPTTLNTSSSIASDEAIANAAESCLVLTTPASPPSILPSATLSQSLSAANTSVVRTRCPVGDRLLQRRGEGGVRRRAGGEARRAGDEHSGGKQKRRAGEGGRWWPVRWRLRARRTEENSSRSGKGKEL